MWKQFEVRNFELVMVYSYSTIPTPSTTTNNTNNFTKTPTKLFVGKCFK
jgi:hypothetical protein